MKTMVGVIVSGIFSFVIGLTYGMYLVVEPEQGVISKMIQFVAKSKGIIESLF